MPIQILDQQVVARIAAGEVIERPASVVKELIENSLDAGSSQISIEISAGGIEQIRVSDNGYGIPQDELEIAFQRHATSKIQRFEDMFSLKSLGFRGEALPSIAAVAEVEISSCATDNTTGAYLTLKNGEVAKKGSLGRPPGTSITVRHLFQSVPARLKFLKSKATESSHIANVVSQYALGFPEVKFSLVMEERTSLITSGSGRLLDAIIAVYGLEVARNMLEIGGEGWQSGPTQIKVSGMVSTPAVSRSNSSYLSFFVNRRWITNRRLAWAVEEAYHGLLMSDKHPLTIINISIAPDEVDVNIHPTKTEVKFRDESSVFSAVQRAVRQSLVQMAPVPSIAEVATTSYKPREQAALFRQTTGAVAANEIALASTKPLPTPRTTLPALRLLGQLRQNYIVAEGPDGLYLIDQHAAHERILFEKLSHAINRKKTEVQALLEPMTLEVSPKQASILQEHYPELAELGFSLEPFGPQSYLARTIPAMLQGKGWKGMLTELLESTSKDSSRFMEELTALTACHSAVRFGQTLDAEEMHQLLRQLEQVSLPHTCPHGRPTLICLTHEQLAREFKRT